MSLRVRMGPFSVSSRGRVGVSAGPVSWSGGGSRRRSGGGGVGLLGGLFFLGLIGLAVEYAIRYWYVTVPALAFLGWLAVAIHRASARAREQEQERLEEAHREEQQRRE